MMVEGDGLDPEQTPPASTRWDQDVPDEDDDSLVPPYAPTRGGPAAEAVAAETTQPAEAAETVEPEPAGEVEDAFPFEAGTAPDEDAFPFDAEGAPDEDAFPFETPTAGTGAVEAGAEADQADDFPAAAFDIEGIEEPEVAETVASKPSDGIAAQLAERLERLAARLRSEGTDAVDAELESRDPFSRLMGAMLAGYLAGRQE